LNPPKSKNSRLRSAKKASLTELPSILECAFGYLGEQARNGRTIYAGINWSAAINNPFRTFSGSGEWLEAALARLYVTQDEPVIYVIHIAHPRVEYTDAGKSALFVKGRGGL
jgi:hypothetical protein